ncbi:TrkH family potassium uptake protein, partial [Dickeya dadantii]|nr:TrkH family potassium uptake protein [Dickeya dadantii]
MKALQYIRIIFMILAIISISFIIPIGTALYENEAYLIPSFLIPTAFVFAVAAAFFFFLRNKKVRLSVSGGIILVAAAWIAAGILGAIPLCISGVIPNFADAIFESVSGFTTTGATILTNVEACPMTMHVWRTQMHWLGG